MSNRLIDQLGGPGLIATAAIPAHAASDASLDHVVLHAAERSLRVRKVTAIPDATLTGADSDSASLNVRTVTAAGSPTEVAHKDYTNAVNQTALIPVELYAPAAPYTTIAVGGSLSIQREKVGSSGLATPRFLVAIEYDYAAA
jgi:hypothetical protein